MDVLKINDDDDDDTPYAVGGSSSTHALGKIGCKGRDDS